MEGSSSVNCKVYKITQAYLKGALQCKKKKWHCLLNSSSHQELKNEECLYGLQSGLGRLACSDRWGISKVDTSRALKSACAQRLALSCCWKNFCLREDKGSQERSPGHLCWGPGGGSKDPWDQLVPVELAQTGGATQPSQKTGRKKQCELFPATTCWGGLLHSRQQIRLHPF